jgi:hypothetical protein
MHVSPNKVSINAGDDVITVECQCSEICFILNGESITFDSSVAFGKEAIETIETMLAKAKQGGVQS